MPEINTKKRTERGASDKGISLEHKVTHVVSLSADVESPVLLEVDEPSLGDIHQILIEVQGEIKEINSLISNAFTAQGLNYTFLQSKI